MYSTTITKNASEPPSPGAGCSSASAPDRDGMKRSVDLWCRDFLLITVFALTVPLPTVAQECPGDCDHSGIISTDELVRGVRIALDLAGIDVCPSLDSNADHRVDVSDLVRAIGSALTICAPPARIATPTRPPRSPTRASPPTPTAIPSATATATATAAPSDSPSPTPTLTRTPRDDGVISIRDAVARDETGVARLLDQRISVEGVVTVSAGLFANNKLKVFVQDEGIGIMIYHQSSGSVEAFQAGDRLRATGVVRQADPTSFDNAAMGTILVDLTGGSWTVLS